MIGAGRLLRTGVIGAVCPCKGPQPPTVKPSMIMAMAAKLKSWLGLGGKTAA